MSLTPLRTLVCFRQTTRFVVPFRTRFSSPLLCHRLSCSSSTTSNGSSNLPSHVNNSSPILSSNKKGPQMAIQFTCKICSSRNTKSFSKRSYTHGLVIVRCDGCENLHLIADNLGWFNHVQGKNIEEILRSKGEEVKNLMKSMDADIDFKFETK